MRLGVILPPGRVPKFNPKMRSLYLNLDFQVECFGWFQRVKRFYHYPSPEPGPCRFNLTPDELENGLKIMNETNPTFSGASGDRPKTE